MKIINLDIWESLHLSQGNIKGGLASSRSNYRSTYRLLNPLGLYVGNVSVSNNYNAQGRDSADIFTSVTEDSSTEGGVRIIISGSVTSIATTPGV